MRLHWFESTMDAANKLLHVFMALALLIVSVLLIWQFVADVIRFPASAGQPFHPVGPVIAHLGRGALHA
jgi:hypothetical protein